jgi:hypothetical protein
MAEELALPEHQLVQKFGQLVAKSVDVVAIADETFNIPRDPKTGGLIRPPGMSDSMWNIHCDAMKSARNAPIYMVEHYTRVQTQQKISGLKGAGLPPIAGLIGVFVKAPQYPVIDVSATPVK